MQIGAVFTHLLQRRIVGLSSSGFLKEWKPSTITFLADIILFRSIIYVANKVDAADVDQTEVHVLTRLTTATAKRNQPAIQSPPILIILDRFDVEGSSGIQE